MKKNSFGDIDKMINQKPEERTDYPSHKIIPDPIPTDKEYYKKIDKDKNEKCKDKDGRKKKLKS